MPMVLHNLVNNPEHEDIGPFYSFPFIPLEEPYAQCIKLDVIGWNAKYYSNKITESNALETMSRVQSL